MLLLGLLLLAAAVIVGVELVLANKAAMVVHLWGWHWNVHAWGMAAWGGAIVLAAVVGWWLIWRGSARSVRRRRERKTLAAENAELARRAEVAEPETARTPASPPEWGSPSSTTDRPGVITSDSMRHQRQVPSSDTPATTGTATTAYPAPAANPYPSQAGTADYSGHPQLSDAPPPGTSTPPGEPPYSTS